MKLALLGSGKTGSKVLELYPGEVTVFNSKNKPTLKKLREHDVLLSFLPGDAFLEYLPLFIESRRPLVIASTGFVWPKTLDHTLKENHLRWIYGSNFSLGIVLTKILIEKINEYQSLFSELHFELHEVHHTKKLDAPSGTALSMASWVKGEVDISSERSGDVVGLHQLVMKTPREEITLTHNALDRSLFAEGALKACSMVLSDKLPPGLHNFQEVMQKQLS